MDDLKRFAAAEAPETDDFGDVPVTVDLTPFNPSSPLVLAWQRPDIPHLYAIGDDAAVIAKKYPIWPVGMVLDVAMMAQCHVLPKTGTLPGKFYSELAARTDAPGRRLWLYLVGRLRKEFPDVVSFTTGQGDLTRIVLPLSESATDTPDDTP